MRNFRTSAALLVGAIFVFGGCQKNQISPFSLRTPVQNAPKSEPSLSFDSIKDDDKVYFNFSAAAYSKAPLTKYDKLYLIASMSDKPAFNPDGSIASGARSVELFPVSEIDSQDQKGVKVFLSSHPSSWKDVQDLLVKIGLNPSTSSYFVNLEWSVPAASGKSYVPVFYSSVEVAPAFKDIIDGSPMTLGGVLYSGSKAQASKTSVNQMATNLTVSAKNSNDPGLITTASVLNDIVGDLLSPTCPLLDGSGTQKTFVSTDPYSFQYFGFGLGLLQSK